MRDPHELYELAGDLPDLGQPAMVHAMSGFVDAGGAARLAREHLLTSSDPAAREVARFDLDQLLDYRSRRPTMLFVADHWESYDAQALALRLLHDDYAEVGVKPRNRGFACAGGVWLTDSSA